MALLGGTVHAGNEVRKTHTYRLDAFGSGDAGPLAYVEADRVRVLRPWPAPRAGAAERLARLQAAPQPWPWVEIVTSGAGVGGRAVQALQAAGVSGLVAAGTGNGTLHEELEAALRTAEAAGVPVLRCSRCLAGSVIEVPGALPAAGALTPQQARVALLLRLLQVD